ncbi:MAG: MarC family protein [Planctomycetota bacterium]
MIDVVATFIFFFAVIDPIGTVPVYIAIAERQDAIMRRRIALMGAAAAAGILLFFVVLGQLILTALNIPLSAFQIAGGVVLFLFALSMIFGESKPEEEIRAIERSTDSAIFPLAVPSIASPGAIMGAVLRTENTSVTFWHQVQVTIVMLGVVGLTCVFMLAGSYILKIIGHAGASIVSRVMGLILASVATANILDGVKSFFLNTPLIAA